MRSISAAANTVVPAIRALEDAGFTVSVRETSGAQVVEATRGEDVYAAEDPVAVLGLVKLVELRGWKWQASDLEIAESLRRHKLA